MSSRGLVHFANAVQANLLAATTDDQNAVNQVYNVAVGDRTSLNNLFECLRSALAGHFDHLQNFSPVYQDFRAGDVRHSLADISKARTLLGYEPTHRIGDGLREALDWYVADLR